MDNYSTITILHYDDEMDSVTPIATSVMNRFLREYPNWVNEEDTVYNDYLKSMTIKPPSHPGGVKLDFLYVDDSAICLKRVKELKKSDIAIFDLMQERDGTIEMVGISLYEEAKKTSIDEKNLFILSGFPHILSTKLGIADTQKFVKPMSPTDIAAKLVVCILNNINNT